MRKFSLKINYHILMLGLIVYFAGVLRFYDLTRPIWPDEALYANAAKNLYTIGELTFDGTPWSFTQPPLFILSLVLSHLVFGLSEFSARMVSPTFGVLGVIATYYLGKYLYNERVGLISAFFIAIVPTHWFFSRMTTPDVLLTMLITLTVVFFYKGLEVNSSKYLIFAGFLIGSVTMTKRVGLIIYPILIIYLILKEKSFKWLKDRNIQSMLTISILLQIPWYIRNYLLFKDPLIKSTSYIPGFPAIEDLDLLHFFKISFKVLHSSVSPPVLLAMLLGVYFIIKEKKKEDVLMLLPIIIFISLFSLWGTEELHRYLLPVVPFFAVIGAYGLDAISRYHIKNKKIYSLLLLLFLFVSLWINLQSGLKMIVQNEYKYQGYDVAGDWINDNVPENALVITNSRAIMYYSNRKSSYFPDSEYGLWELIDKGNSDVYLVIGEWPTTLGYPEYVRSLPENWKNKTTLEATFYQNLVPVIEIYRVKRI